jgi:hypothetical protein
MGCHGRGRELVLDTIAVRGARSALRFETGGIVDLGDAVVVVVDSREARLGRG